MFLTAIQKARTERVRREQLTKFQEHFSEADHTTRTEQLTALKDIVQSENWENLKDGKISALLTLAFDKDRFDLNRIEFTDDYFPKDDPNRDWCFTADILQRIEIGGRFLPKEQRTPLQNALSDAIKYELNNERYDNEPIDFSDLTTEPFTPEH